MTKHDLAMLALDAATRAARDLVKELERARVKTDRRSYKEARSLISDAISTASYLDHHYLRNCATALEDCS